MRFREEVVDMELIDEIKSQLPIPAYASQDLSRYLAKNGKNIKPDTELKILQVFDSGNEGGIACLLDVVGSDSFVISLALLRIKPDHPLADKISAYQKKRIRSIFRSKGFKPRRR